MFLLVSRDFSIRYVWGYTSTDLELGYVMSAFWAGQAGGILLWEWMLIGFTMIVVFPRGRADTSRLASLTAVVLALLNLFFLALLVFARMPFESTPTELLMQAPEGLGLNPQLQNIGMVFHPPSLYVGFVGFSVPFAYAVAALILNQVDIALFRRMRLWMLVTWVFLGIGNVLGAQWAYVELGWGGYWAWDPVENASFIPWLTATAYLHAAVVSDRRGGLQRWSLIMLFSTFVLTIVGTFLTRSGIISSVHAYTDADLLLVVSFLIFIGLSSLVPLALLIWRWRYLDAPSEGPDTLVAREGGFALTAILFIALAVAVLVGTLYPLFSPFIFGREITWEVWQYERISAVLSIAIVLLLGVCPALRWRGQPWSELGRYLAVPAGAGVVATVVAFLVGSSEPFVVLSFAACAFAITSALEATFLDWRRRHEAGEGKGKGAGASLWELLTGNRRRYGGYLVHIGVVLLVAGVVGSTVYAQEQTVTLQKGDRTTMGEYAVHFMDLDIEILDNGRAVVRAPMTVVRGGSSTVLMPQMVYYPTQQETPSSDPAIWGGPGQLFLEDFYVLMASLEPHGGLATFQMHVNPLMDWIWGGGFIMLLGSVWALWPRQTSRRVEQKSESVESGQGKKGPRGKRR
jgi:cytochrome c-type biogenesis protein CcmF